MTDLTARLSGRCAVITGGASGIGLATARRAGPCTWGRQPCRRTARPIPVRPRWQRPPRLLRRLPGTTPSTYPVRR